MWVNDPQDDFLVRCREAIYQFEAADKAEDTEGRFYWMNRLADLCNESGIELMEIEAAWRDRPKDSKL
ncbi:hypothetical protein [Estrella lausannensis]|uniref:Uncharacterized protein n=1 Tax=Estrella lausannensis TaxID=483423 RepID=A0A0H5DUG9_9BACT|nr:hypothetical protein [Estrella lausannensis]CRX39579.1 hypothetical protein ELAC_p0002 [Estrella lausannensis]